LLYDEARFRQKLGLAQKGCNFTELAQTTLVELRASLGAGEKRGKSVNLSYISCIEKYFLPYFGDRTLEELTHSDVIQFEAWRNRQMMKVPRASTLNNFAAAWSRLSQTAINRGWISQHAVIPKLSTKGQKSTPRPAFTAEEVEQLLAYMQGWISVGRFSVENETRPLLRDYVEMLLLTGMRHGTEAMGLCWNHCEWYLSKGARYLRLWVDGKTGPRWLIAKHRSVEVLERLHARQKDIAAKSFDELLQSRAKQLVFRFSDGYQPPRPRIRARPKAAAIVAMRLMSWGMKLPCYQSTMRDRESIDGVDDDVSSRIKVQVPIIAACAGDTAVLAIQRSQPL